MLLPLLLLPGCLGDGPAASEPPRRAVSGSLALGRPPAGPPDAGTARGHGRRAPATAFTRRKRFTLRGTVAPAASEVRLLDGATGEQAAIAVRRGAGFAFTLPQLRPGVSRFVIEAALVGHAPWRQPLRVVRRAPRERPSRRVVVTGTDRSPAEALLRLDRRSLAATAIGRDAGGMARIRVSAELRLRCREAGGCVRELGLVRHDPPSQVEHVRVSRGTRVPSELRRRSALLPAARARCRRDGAHLEAVAGIAWAEATNARGLDRYSADVRVAWPASGTG